MSLWQILTFCIVAGGFGYTYVVQPMSLQLGIPRIQCWWADGVYLRATAKEAGYDNIMRNTSDNFARLKTGEAVGCFNEGQCVQSETEAVSTLERKIISWAAIGGGQLVAGNIYGMLGLKSKDNAQAKLAEAQYCVNYLGKQRQLILTKSVSATASIQ